MLRPTFMTHYCFLLFKQIAHLLSVVTSFSEFAQGNNGDWLSFSCRFAVGKLICSLDCRALRIGESQESLKCP